MLCVYVYMVRIETAFTPEKFTSARSPGSKRHQPFLALLTFAPEINRNIQHQQPPRLDSTRFTRPTTRILDTPRPPPSVQRETGDRQHPNFPTQQQPLRTNPSTDALSVPLLHRPTNSSKSRITASITPPHSFCDPNPNIIHHGELYEAGEGWRRYVAARAERALRAAETMLHLNARLAC